MVLPSDRLSTFLKMRRKSTRNVQKSTPEKPVKETGTPTKTRRSKRRKRSPSKSSDSEGEVITVIKHPEPETTPDTTTQSHTPTDEETSEEPVWKVTSSEDATKGEIQKLKICLTRPSPDSPDKTKSRRSKSSSQTEDDATSSEDKSSTTTTRRTRSRGSPFIRNDGLSSQEGDEDVEEKKGKGKSKGKHKSKIEKSPHLSEPEIQTNNEISENVQVTPQSPSIDKPVDNENDYNKVDVDDKNVNESAQKQGDIGEDSASSITRNSDNNQDNSEIVKDVPSQDDVKQQTDTQDKESDDDDEPLSVIQKNVNSEKQATVPENVEVVAENTDLQLSDAPNITEIVATTEEPQENVEEITEKETSQENNVQIPEEPEREVLEEPAEDSNKEELHAEIIIEQTVEETVPLETEHLEETEEKSSENVISQEDAIEHEPQPSTSEDIVPQDTEENNSTDDNEADQSKASNENVTELQVNESPNESPKSPKETPLASTSVTEERQDNSEPVLRRKLKRNNECVKNNSKEDGNEDSSHIKPSKSKRKWEGSTQSAASLLKIDLESIQIVWPTIDFPKEPDLNLDSERERRKSVTESSSGKKLERKVSIEYKSDNSEKIPYEKQSSVSSVTQESEDNSNIIAFNRKISIVDDTASKLKPPPSPAKNPVSDVLYITNLVRPFTLKQLKELLERTGKINEEGFWTDRIKSKCYVKYETEEEAEATRNALHGVQWPIGNGKKLIIDYASVEDLKNAKNPPAPPPVAPTPEVKVSVKENLEPVEDNSRGEEKVLKDAEKKRSEGPVREWDIGKKDVRRERSRSRDRSRKHRRSPSPSDDFITRKQRKAEESVPQKLMDDLFLKTKATPSIYWQPLSPEEISMKQQQRLIRMEEHKRRMEENSRLKGRDVGRGAFRRRYD